MKNDYLWDKTGNDSEIKKLEDKLNVFRIQETNAPQIQNNVVQFKKKTPQKLFPAFRALAAGFAFFFIIVGVSFVFFNSQNETVQNQKTEFAVENEITENHSKTEFVQPRQSDYSVAKKNSDNSFRDLKPETKKQSSKAPKLIYKSKAKPRYIEKPQIVKLSVEEKEAYDKLMLALSITSSKLKIVKDKVQNLDEQTAINTENKYQTRKK